MAKTLHRLTPPAIKSAQPGAVLNDGGGLFYRATTKGSGRWTFRFTSSDPAYVARQVAKGSGLRQREMGLGDFPGTSLAIAREKATAARDTVARGLDPIAEAERVADGVQKQAEADAKAEVEQAMTFGRYADEIFLPSVLPQFSNAVHIQQWKSTFTLHGAALRAKPLASITREDVLEVLRPIWSSKSVTASRCRERFDRLFAHATQNGMFHRDNPAAWRQFNATLPPPRKLTRGHHAAIPHDEIPSFMAVIRAKQADGTAALMLEWIVLAACRTGEARFAVWSEIDEARKLWVIPAARMKMRREHEVPLTERMLEILAEAKRRRTKPPEASDLVFCHANGARFSVAAARQRLRSVKGYEEHTVHGLRASFKGWAATTTDFPRELIEEQLAHELGSVERAYMRVSAVERRRAMMEAWSCYCEGKSPAGAASNVVPLRAGSGSSA